MTGICLAAVALWLALQLPLGMLIGRFLRKGQLGCRPEPAGRFVHYSWPRRAYRAVPLRLTPVLVANSRRGRLPQR
jgi:hypothetical protein